MTKKLPFSVWILMVQAAAVCLMTNRPVYSQGCPGSGMQSTGPDVIVGELANNPFSNPGDIANYTNDTGYDAVSCGTVSCNLGNVALNWQGSPSSTHPVISQNLFRLKLVSGSNRFEHIGVGWLKHGFEAWAENNCCATCNDVAGSVHLGVGCSDPYSASRNGGQSSLGPRWVVNATTGVHTHPGGYPAATGNTGRRVKIKTSDLAVSSGSNPLTVEPRFYSEGQYVAADDAAANNKNNNASYRPMGVSGGPTNFTFVKIGSTQRQQAGIRAWKDFDSSVVETDVIVPEDAGANALVMMAAQATDLGGGIWHYEFAVHNLNSDRCVGGFTVPVSGYATVTNIGFHDVDYHSGDGLANVTRDGTDWPATDWATQNSSEKVSWGVAQDYATNNNGNGIRWGTLYNFRFDANIAPTNGDVTLTQYKVVNNVSATTVIPASVSCTRGDINGDGAIDGIDIQLFTDLRMSGGGSPQQRCAADVELSADFVVDDDDIEPFAVCLLNTGC